ncbi:metallopeptidase family protein [Pontivivens insulae]|nr:metallopeptidase family protein [Pontivivens insulae]
MALNAFQSLPDEIRTLCADLRIIIEDFADDALLDELGIENPFELTGLYSGVALTEKSFSDPSIEPDTVYLFRRPILEEWIERETVDLSELVAHVLVHEIAHHFGWSDERIMQIDDWTE